MIRPLQSRRAAAGTGRPMRGRLRIGAAASGIPLHLCRPSRLADWASRPAGLVEQLARSRRGRSLPDRDVMGSTKRGRRIRPPAHRGYRVAARREAPLHPRTPPGSVLPAAADEAAPAGVALHHSLQPQAAQREPGASCCQGGAHPAQDRLAPLRGDQTPTRRRCTGLAASFRAREQGGLRPTSFCCASRGQQKSSCAQQQVRLPIRWRRHRCTA